MKTTVKKARAKAARAAKVKSAIRVRKFLSYWENEHEVQLDPQKPDAEKLTKEFGAAHVTEIRITPGVEVGTEGGYLCFWVEGREVRVGPFTPDQAEKLAEDLGYEAVA
jgi:hypothetical protein